MALLALSGSTHHNLDVENIQFQLSKVLFPALKAITNGFRYNFAFTCSEILPADYKPYSIYRHICDQRNIERKG